MLGFDVLVIIVACAGATVKAQSESLPIVDLGYAIQQATLNVSICLHLCPSPVIENLSGALFSRLILFCSLSSAVGSKSLTVVAGHRYSVLQFQQYPVRRSSGGKSTLCRSHSSTDCESDSQRWATECHLSPG